MPPAPTSAQRVAKRRAALRAQGLRPIQKSGSPIPAPRASPRRALAKCAPALCRRRSTLATARVLHHQVQRCIVCSSRSPSVRWRQSIMDGTPCRSLRAQPCSSPNDRGNIWRSFTPIRRSMGARRLNSTCNDSLQSPRQPSTRWCSAWNVADCFAAPRDRPAASKFSSPPRISLSCDEQ